MAYHGEYNDENKQQTIKWDDTKYEIEWPCTNPILSKRDANGN
jgi:dTDP-4-dehydrorhamnose 3,5-epimerase-like enzyme